MAFRGRVDIDKMQSNFRRRSKKAMTRAVVGWYAASIITMPVRAAKREGQFAKTGRGMLKKTKVSDMSTLSQNHLILTAKLKDHIGRISKNSINCYHILMMWI